MAHSNVFSSSLSKPRIKAPSPTFSATPPPHVSSHTFSTSSPSPSTLSPQLSTQIHTQARWTFFKLYASLAPVVVLSLVGTTSNPPPIVRITWAIRLKPPLADGRRIAISTGTRAARMRI